MELLIVCMLAVFLVAAFGQRVSTAGDSMSPSLKNGDILLINRAVYHIKSPARGDIVAFRQGRERSFFGKADRRTSGRDGTDHGWTGPYRRRRTDETIYVSDIEYAGEAEQPVELGDDEYFVIGDNHAASDDSRLPSIGAVTRDEIYGEAWFIVSPGRDFGFIG